MPIFDQGYRHWDGVLASQWLRWFAITRRGVKAQLRNRWIKAAVLVGWAAPVALATLLIVWGLLEQKSTYISFILTMIDPKIRNELLADPHALRPVVWTVLFGMFWFVQLFFVMVIVLLVGPDLISQDLRNNAFPLYFSKPLRRIDYFIGKLGVIATFLAAVTLVPVLLAFVLGVGFSLDIGVIKDTIPLLGRNVLYCVIVIVSAGTLMLAISSLSRNSRHVSAIWLAFWVTSGIFASVLGESIEQKWCPIVSYTQNLWRLSTSLLGLREGLEKLQTLFGRAGQVFSFEDLLVDGYPALWSAGVLAGLFAVSTLTLSLRVRSLDNLK